MDPRLTANPELQKFLKMRAIAGGVVLLTVAVGFATLAAFAPPKPAHISVNCVETQAPTLVDFEQGRVGCATSASAPAPAPGSAPAAASAPAADAKADDPPIPTF